MEVKKDLRKVLSSNKIKLKERIKAFKKACEVNNMDEARFWWAKIVRRMESLNNILDSLSNEPDKPHHPNDHDFLTNKQHTINSRQELFLIQKDLNDYKTLFRDVPHDYGYKAEDYKTFLKKNKKSNG